MEKQSNRILLLEDDEFISRSFSVALTDAGFEVFEADSCIEGLEHLNVEKPNLVLLDLLMPGKDGYYFLENIKANPKFSEVPVVVLSNLGQQGDIEKAMRMGAKAYLIKSDHSLKEIIENVKSFLSV